MKFRTCDYEAQNEQLLQSDQLCKGGEILDKR